MQMQQPLYFPSGANAGMRPSESTMAGAPFPIAYIAVPVSEPLRQSQQLVLQQPQKPQKPRGLSEPLLKALTGLGAAQILVGLSSIVLEAVTVTTQNYYRYFAGLWCGPVFLITGIVACSAAKARKTGPIIGTMVMSIISSVLFICQFTFSMVQYFRDRNLFNVVTNGLLAGLSGVELIFAIACAVCCCKAICLPCRCCCEIIDESRPQINQSSFENSSWTANPYQPNVGQQPYSPAAGFPLQSQSIYNGPSEISGHGAATVGGGSGYVAGPSSSLSA